MAEVKRPLKVFLCHASADKPKVRKLYEELKRYGIQPWFDAEDLLVGQDWKIEIPKAIASSDGIIICLSKNAVDKVGYVQSEIKFALDKAHEMPEGRNFIFPIRLEECKTPDSLERYHWGNLFEEDGYIKLMKSLTTHAAQLGRTVVEIPKLNQRNLINAAKNIWFSLLIVYIFVYVAFLIVSDSVPIEMKFYSSLGFFGFPILIITFLTIFRLLSNILLSVFEFTDAFRKFISRYNAENKDS